MLAPVLAITDLAVLLAATWLVIRWLARPAQRPRAWLVVLAVTTAYVLYANLIVRFISYTVSTYVLIICTIAWDHFAEGVNPTRSLHEYGAVPLLLASWVVISLPPTLLALLLRVTGMHRK